MKNTRRKGFTLIEILVTIILLAIVGTIVIYNVSQIQSSSKQENQKKYEAAVQSAASVYADENPDAFNELHVNKAFLYIKAGDLIDAGYLSGDLVNPETGLVIGRNELVKVSLDSQSGGLIFTYPVSGEEEENFLVSLDEWIVWREPYNCFHGAGTYSFALSDESGNLIDLSKKENIEKYHVSCEYPEGWGPISENEKAAYGIAADDDTTYYHYPAKLSGNSDKDKNGGTFKVKYTWLTESGVRKEATRTIIVQSKVRAYLKGVEMQKGQSLGKDVSLGNKNNQYVPKYDTSSRVWTYLGLMVDVDGADKSTTSYTIMKTTWGSDSEYFNGDADLKKQRNKYRDVINNTEITGVTKDTSGTIIASGLTPSTDFITPYVADDGKTDYIITTNVKGHFNTGYTYQSQDTASTNVKLYIPDDFIKLADSSSSGPNDWYMKHDVTIYFPYSPVGIWGYYVELVNDNNSKLNVSKFVSRKTDTNFKNVGGNYSGRISLLTTGAVNMFTADKIVSTYNASTVNSNENSDACTTSVYSTIRVKPINENGYVGSASNGSNLHVTNRFGLLIANSANTNGRCGDGCANVSQLSPEYQTYLKTSSKNESSGSSAYNKAVASTTFIMKGLSCYYCTDTKAVYVRPSFKRKKTDSEDFLYSLAGIYKGTSTDPKDSKSWSYLVTPYKYMTDNKSESTRQGCYSLSSIHSGTWTINTCDGTYSTAYDMISPTFRENILRYIANYINANYANATAKTWLKKFNQVQCKATVGADYSNKVVELLPKQSYQWGRLTEEWKEEGRRQKTVYDNLVDEMTKNSSYRYDSKICIPNYQDYLIFDTAIFRSNDRTRYKSIYWLAATKGEKTTIKVRHGDATTIYNTYYYARLENGQVSDRYYGDCARLKPLMKLSNVDCVLDGTGDKDEPYILAVG